MPLLVGLYLLACAVNLLSVRAAATPLVLMGEEMSVSIRDVLFSVEQRAQATVWSTNFAAPVYYWLASHLDPSYSLFSARRWKAVAMALLAPLAYLVLRRRLSCGVGPAALGGVATMLLPGVAMFGWLATENGLETLVGAAGLYLATSQRRGWLAAPILAGLAVTTYPSGMAWAAVILAVSGWRAIRSGWRVTLAALASGLVGLGVVLLPLWWWQAGPERIVSGGGTLEATPLANLMNLAHQLAVSGRSYYYFADLPAFGSAPLAAAVGVVAIMTAALRWQASWPWLAVGAATLVMWLPTGNMPGVRRAVALSLIAALVLAVTADIVAQVVSVRARPWIVAAAAVAVCAPLAVSLAGWQSDFRAGRQTLVADFPIAPGPMPPTFAAYDAALRSGMTAEQAADVQNGRRTTAVVWLLAERTGRGVDGLPSPAEIVSAGPTD